MRRGRGGEGVGGLVGRREERRGGTLRQTNPVHRPQEAGSRVRGACTDLLNPYNSDPEGFVPGGWGGWVGVHGAVKCFLLEH